MTNAADKSLPEGTVHEDVVVAACEPWSAHVKRGDVLRLVDLEGQQAIDFLCYNATDPSDRYNAANTMKLNKNIYLSQGSVLWSVRAREMMTCSPSAFMRQISKFA